MSARLNMDPIRFISWKGLTFNQLTSVMQKNNDIKNTNTNISNTNYFRARPLNIYRKEIANTTTSCTRKTMSIDELNRPNGYLIYQSTTNQNKGLASTLEIPIPNDSTMLGTASCNTRANCLSQESNARRRVRSSGNIKKKYDPDTNTLNYYTSSNQYLSNRNKTFLQNEFRYQSVAQNNSCVPTDKPNNTKFHQQGAVTSSALIHRVKFDQLNTNRWLN